jgi:hypothetical protein
MHERKPPIRSYTKSELAMLYVVDTLQETAERILRRWIHGNPELMKALQEKNYNKHCHILAPIHVQIIFEHLGEP